MRHSFHDGTRSPARCWVRRLCCRRHRSSGLRVVHSAFYVGAVSVHVSAAWQSAKRAVGSNRLAWKTSLRDPKVSHAAPHPLLSSSLTSFSMFNDHPRHTRTTFVWVESLPVQFLLARSRRCSWTVSSLLPLSQFV